ncbi:MAG: hypothetical protein ACUVR0_03810 [Candidatus Aminicenantales bacterium]
MLQSLRRFSRSEVAEQRMKIIRFYEEYGEKVTKEAFGASSEVISRWRKRLKVKHPLRPEDFGYIVSDKVERVTDGVKDYFYNAIDAKLKFALTLNYKRLISRNRKDFYNKFKEVYPLAIKSWQTDNGPENLGEFEAELKREGIPHYFSYPRLPKINASLERSNRTIQEEFIDNNLDIIQDKPLFHERLADYLIFSNTQRPPKSLGLKSPVEYLIEKGAMSQMSLTYTEQWEYGDNYIRPHQALDYLTPYEYYRQWKRNSRPNGSLM